MKYYKVYEILDNIEIKQDIYPVYFVGAFEKEEDANKLCEVIDIMDCNSTHIEFNEITKQDVLDLKKFGLQAADKSAMQEIEKIIKNLNKEDELTK